MINFVTWKWKSSRPYRSKYDGKTVNVLRNMIARHYHLPHKFTCVTDDPSGVDSDITVVPLVHHFADVPNPSNVANPTCYRRLWAFSPEAQDVLGERIVSMDLDIVVTSDLVPMLNRDDDFVIWGGQALGPGRLGTYNWVNGSFWMLRTGTRTKVWTDFDPKTSPIKAHTAGCRGSDQGWIAYSLGKKEALFKSEDGIHSFRNHVQPNKGKLFPNTRVVVFHGKHDPWDPIVQLQYPWVKEYYQ